MCWYIRPMPRKFKIIFCFLSPLAVLYSQPKEATTLVLKSARLYDGISVRMMSPGLVVVRGDRIDAVGSGTAIPPGSAVIDLGDATLLPGFIDAHTHLGWAYAASYDQREMERMRRSSAELALDASVWVRKTLMAGFTTVRDLGSTDFIDIALRNAIRGALDRTLGARRPALPRLASLLPGNPLSQPSRGLAQAFRYASPKRPLPSRSESQSQAFVSLAL